MVTAQWSGRDLSISFLPSTSKYYRIVLTMIVYEFFSRHPASHRVMGWIRVHASEIRLLRKESLGSEFGWLHGSELGAFHAGLLLSTE